MGHTRDSTIVYTNVYSFGGKRWLRRQKRRNYLLGNFYLPPDGSTLICAADRNNLDREKDSMITVYTPTEQERRNYVVRMKKKRKRGRRVERAIEQQDFVVPFAGRGRESEKKSGVSQGVRDSRTKKMW